jgi:predicted transcriptional regulator
MPGYLSVVNIQLPGSVEQQLRTLAENQGRDLGVLVEEAVRQYLEAAAITDLDAHAVADAQAALLGELPHIPDWKTGDA